MSSTFLRNGQSLTPREYNYKEIVEEFTNNSDADGLKDAVKALNDNDNFKGWLASCSRMTVLLVLSSTYRMSLTSLEVVLARKLLY